MSEEPDFWRSLYSDRHDERVIEYPYIFRNLRPLRLDTTKVLDVGCCDSGLAAALFKMGYEATGIDIRDYKTSPPRDDGFKFIKADIRKTDFPPDFFDQILCISTVEHIGLNAYSNKVMESAGDLTAMAEMRRILKPYGILILTVPFGCHKNDYWIRYYNKDTLRQLTSGFSILDMMFSKKRVNISPPVWTQCTIEEAGKMGVGSGAVPLAVACMTLTK